MEQVAKILTFPNESEQTNPEESKNQNRSSPSCWRCQDTRFVAKMDSEGIERHAPCACQRLRILRTSVKVPPAFGKPVLGRLKARGHKRQESVIGMLKQNPERSYLFTGRNGCGKTHFCWALCRAALIRGNRVRGMLLSELMNQYRDCEIDKEAPRPAVLPEDLKQPPQKYTLFLDEFEKVKTSEFSSRKLFELLNAARDFQHQVLVTSNKEWSQLREVWSRADDTYGDSIMQRLAQCQLIEMF